MGQRRRTFPLLFARQCLLGGVGPPVSLAGQLSADPGGRLKRAPRGGDQGNTIYADCLETAEFQQPMWRKTDEGFRLSGTYIANLPIGGHRRAVPVGVIQNSTAIRGSVLAKFLAEH